MLEMIFLEKIVLATRALGSFFAWCHCLGFFQTDTKVIKL